AYLGAADAALQARVLRSLAGSGVLTVYDAAERRPGGAIRMFVEDQRMRFEVNTAVVEREHLELSSRLLGVAQLVRDP
ncbi:MAG TPA: YfiR family protein, partial [Nevskiaceae bacterium]|nr:YfiR family protein [Nevskiaceae bacterium]